MNIIGFGHRKRVGKDTAAQYLKKRLHSKYPDASILQVGFADKVKDVSHQLFG